MSKTKNTSHKSQSGFATWLLHNAYLLVVCIVLGYFLSHVDGIKWVTESYCKKFLTVYKEHADATYDQKMTMKLGMDYLFLLYVRDHTPENSIIYLPTREDMLSPQPNGKPSPFKATMTDKLSAAKILYPRRVITEDEWGVTTWARYTTHVAIVNGKNVDKLTYHVDKFIPFGVLPTIMPKGNTDATNGNQPAPPPEP